MVYDDDVNGNRIRMTKDNDALICNHIICKDYQLQWYVSLYIRKFADKVVDRTVKSQISS